MAIGDLFFLWTESVPLAGLSWGVLLLGLLYLARRPAHRLLYSAGRSLRRLLGALADTLLQGSRRVARHNRKVALETARAAQRRLSEREFDRVQRLVSRDLAAYPALQRQLSDQIARVDQDYRQSVEEPPSPPGWLEAVEAVARIPSNGDPMVAQILDDIRRTLERACHESLVEYRAASRKRHVWLKRMLPYWRRLSRVLQDMERGVEALGARSAAIDRRMDEYAALRREEAAGLPPLQPSVLNQLLVSGGVLLVAVLGALAQFHLLAPGMAVVFGDASLPGPWSGAGLGTAVVLALELVAGLMLCETAGASRLLPFVAQLEAAPRRRLAWVAGVALLVMAAGAALTLLEAPLAPGGPGRALLAFALPLLLALAAIPLESCLQALRATLGAALEAGLRLTARLLRLTGAAAVASAALLARAYDLLIFIPLWLERRLRSGTGRRAASVRLDEATSGH